MEQFLFHIADVLIYLNCTITNCTITNYPITFFKKLQISTHKLRISLSQISDFEKKLLFKNVSKMVKLAQGYGFIGQKA